MRGRAQRHGDFYLILTLFVSFRLLTLALFRYGGFFGHASDYDYYQQVAAQSDRGAFPLVDFWMEYPPVFPWLSIVAYRLALLLPGHPPVDVWFRIILGCFLLAFETGNLALVYRIGRRLYKHTGALRVAWIYSALFAPVFVWAGWFDSFPVFLTLLSLDLLLARRLFLAGLATGFGFVVKLMPALVGLTAARTLVGHAPTWPRMRRLGVYAAGASLAAFVCLAPFAAMNWPVFAASVRSWLFRAPWETFWALSEGYYSFGAVATLASRAWQLVDVPWQRETSTTGPWALIALGLPLVWLYARRFEDARARPLVAFAGLSVNLFVLASAGFSPQFVVWLMPFVVLLLPSLRGVGYATALTVVTLLGERYLYFSLYPDQHWLLWAIVAVRTALILGLSVEYYALLRVSFAPTWERIWARALPGVVAGCAVVTLGVGAELMAQYAASSHEIDRAIVQANELKAMVPAGEAIIFTDGSLYSRLYPYMMDRPVFLLSKRALASIGSASAEEAIRDIARRYPWPHVVQAAGEADRPGDYVTGWLGRYGYLIDRADLDTSEVLSYALPQRLARASEVPDHPQLVNFGNEISLLGYTVKDDGLVVPGQSIDVSLYWRATRPVSGDYTLTIRLLDPGGTVLAQYESQPVAGGLPTSKWVPGELIIDDHRLPIGQGLPAGRYRLEVGWHGERPDQALTVVGSGAGASADEALLQSVEVVDAASSSWPDSYR